LCRNTIGVISEKEEERNPVNKNQGWEPIHQKYKAKENTSKHNPEKRQKSGKDLMQRGLTTMK
jgi:hypothetical protein